MKIRSHLIAIHAILSDMAVDHARQGWRHSGWSGEWKDGWHTMVPHSYCRTRVQVRVRPAGFLAADPTEPRLAAALDELDHVYGAQLHHGLFKDLPLRFAFAERAIELQMRLAPDNTTNGGTLVGHVNMLCKFIKYACHLLTFARRHTTPTFTPGLPHPGTAPNLLHLASSIGLPQPSLNVFPPEPEDPEADPQGAQPSDCIVA